MDWIVASNVERETWRRLLEFANLELAEAAIARIHGPPGNGRHATNYRKQANQMRVALLQAKEYFDAAEKSSLITSPNHLYYGTVSLASAVMLLRGSGERSYDFLRRETKNNHHGLAFTVSTPSKEAGIGSNLLETARIAIAPWGHFHNWYSVLPSAIDSYGIVKEQLSGAQSTAVRPVGGDHGAPLSQMVGRKKTVLQTMLSLPELQTDLTRYGFEVVASKVTQVINIKSGGATTHRWVVHNAGSNSRLLRLLEGFAFLAQYMDRVSVRPDIFEEKHSGCIIEYTRKGSSDELYSWPSSRVAINGDVWFFEKNADVHEFVDWYIASFGLSMLSRYFPDLWIACLDAHCRSAKIIESFTEVARLKVPLLALELLNGSPLRIGSHPAPWS